MKLISLILLQLMIFNQATAFTIWPDTSAPCNGTLQACIDGSPEGEYIEVRTNNTINENIFTNNVVSLVAGRGYKPVFSAGNGIRINSNITAERTLTIQGFTLTQGKIEVTHSGNNARFIIANNTILDNPGNLPSISVGAFGNAITTVDIKYNQVSNDVVGSVGANFGAIRVYKSGGEVGGIEGQIYGNKVTALGIESVGILIHDQTDASVDLNVTGNEIYGGTQGGLLLSRAGGNGDMDIDVSSNAFYREGNFYFPSGLHVVNSSGTANVDIINNTMLESRYGIWLSETGSGDLTARVYNNLVAFGINGYRFESRVDVTNNYNLSYQNTSNLNYTPGLNAVTANPMIKGLQDARLRPGSPAEGSGNSLALLFAGDAPFIDADGLLRIKASLSGNLLDIGAYEQGDVSFFHRHAQSGTHVTIIDNEATNDLPSLDNLLVTATYNPEETGGVVNNANEGIYYALNRWRIFNEEVATDLGFSAAFNVAKMAAVSNTFEHINTSSGINSTEIDRAGMNDNPDLHVQITQHWTGTYNTHPVAVLYFANHWRIINTDLANMPTNANFNVYYQRPSKSAWQHRAVAANTINNFSYLDHPAIQGVNCAQLQVTQNTTSGVSNGSPIGVGYEGFSGRWYVYNQDSSDMPVNATFNVLINPEQIAACTDLIFADDFE